VKERERGKVTATTINHNNNSHVKYSVPKFNNLKAKCTLQILNYNKIAPLSEVNLGSESVGFHAELILIFHVVVLKKNHLHLIVALN
jgi:hypothetical protein